MFSSRVQRRTSLIAVFLLLWSFVFPALASVSVSRADLAWTEVCTAHGIKKIQQSPNDSHPLGHHVAAKHCALCCLDGMQVGIEPTILRVGLDLDQQAYVLPSFDVELPDQFVLLTAPPRAPPPFLS